MATNSDGGIVLSVSIDSSEVSSDMKKVVSEINKQVQAEAKNLKAVESVNQAKEKSAQYQAKTNQEVYKEVEAEYKALTAEQNLNTAKEKGAIVSAKKVVEEEKSYQALVKSEIAENNLQQSQNATLISEQKLTTEKEKGYQATLQSQIKEQKLAQEIENSATAEAKKQKAMLDAQKKQQDLLIGEQKLKKATEDAATAQEKHKQAIISTEKAQNSLKTATNSVTTAIKKMATQLGIAFSIKQIINFSKEAGELASQTEAYLTRMSMLYGEAAQDVYDWANANSYALGMAKSTAYEAVAQYGNLFTTFASATESAQLSIDMLQATAVVASQMGRTYEETFEKIQSGIYGNTRAIDDLGISVRQSSLMQTQAWQTVSKNGTKSWNDLTDAELQQLRVLGIIEQSTAKYGNTVMQTSALTRAQFNAAWKDFKDTWGQAVNQILIPIMSWLTVIIEKITSFMKMFIKTDDVSKNFVGSGQQSVENQEELNDELDETNKKLKKSLASFDEINQLQTETEDNGSNAEVSNQGISEINVPIQAEVTEVEIGNADEIKTKILNDLASLLDMISGFLVVIGVILLCMGNIPFGVGCILAGLMAGEISNVVEQAEGDTPEEKIKNILLQLKETIGEYLFVIGVILLCFGQIALGIGAMVAGAILYNIQEMDGDFDTLTVEEKIATIEQAVGAALFVIGVVLLCFGQIALGIGAIVMGAAAFGVAEEDLDEDKTKTGISKFLDDNMDLLLGVATALVVLGVVLLLTGVGIPLAIGMIVAGGGILAAEIAENADEVKNKVSKFLDDNKALIVGIGIALVVIGIILCVTGVGIALGIGCIVAGGAAIATEAVLNWEKIKEKVKSIMNEIFEWLKIAAKLVLGVILTLGGVTFPLGLALIIDGVEELTEKANIDWDAVKTKVSEVIETIKDWVKTYGMLVLGIILCLTGVGIPLGIKLIVDWCKDNYGEVELATAIVDKVKEIWKKIKEFWAEHIEQIFTKEWWIDLAKKCGNGLISGFESAINGVITLFEDMINYVVTNLNKLSFDIPDWVPIIGGGTFGFNLPKVKIDRVSFPRLAQGAVIPANREFLAVLGDQKHGTNIEAPAELIKQMALEALAEYQAAMPQQGTDITIRFEGTESQLFKYLVPRIDKYNNHRGTNLLTQRQV